MKPPNFWRSFCFKSNSTQISLMPQIVFAAFLFPTDFTDNTDFRPDRSEVIVTLISQILFLGKSYILFLIAVSLCTSRHSNEEYCFILLLTELPLGRCPSGLWRKSYDRHWRLMNDHNDRGYHL